MTGRGADEAMGERWRAVAAVNAAAVIFGAAALFGRLDASPVWIVAGRSLFAAAALLAVARLKRTPLRLTPREAAAVAGCAAILALHWVSFFASVQMAGVAVATLTVSAFPLFTVLIAAAWARRTPSAQELAAGATIVLAVALIARPDAAGPGALAGAALGVLAAATFAVFGLFSQALAARLGLLRLTASQYAMVVLLLAPALPFTAPLTGPTAWLAVALLGVIGTALAHQLYLFGLGRLPAAACGAMVSIEPVYAILLAALLFGEPAGPAVVASAALIVGASWTLMRRPPEVPAGG